MAAPGLAAAQPNAGAKPSIAQFMNIPSPLELTGAARADRIAWTVYDRGMRNVYTAAAPSWTPVRLTRFLEDNGTDVSSVRLSADGSVAVFVRGSAPNSEGWVANPSHDPDGAERAIWAVRTSGGTAWRVAEGSAPVLAPNGRHVLYVRDGQIYRAPVSRSAPANPIDRGEKPFISAWGRNSSPRWSPDGSKIAFVSDRTTHSFIAVYDVATRTVSYMAPSVDRDGSPTWSPDGKRIAFVRRPGQTFGQQVGAAGAPPARGDSLLPSPRDIPGMFRASFTGGHTVMFMIADVATAEAREFWRSQPEDRIFGNTANIQWAGDHVIFSATVPGDEWDRWFSVSLEPNSDAPTLLTSTNGMIEGAVSTALSRDGRTLYYSTNAGDIERRDIWSVPTAGGTPVNLTAGDGVETHPVPLSSGAGIAVLYFDVRQPASVGIVPTQGGKARLIYPALPREFPIAEHVVPEIVVNESPDGVMVTSQLFLPHNLAPGERRPAIVFVHGGPRRQMLPAYHYMQFYHWAYGWNQWLANQGYVVLSVNFRSGVGYGRSFTQAPRTGAAGNSEYQDILAAGQYLAQRPDVDPSRIGIWGLSYGGILTAQALARNSDLFIAGIDLAGVHLRGTSLDPASISYQSSAISAMSTWKSPVLLVHGDDDRNVAFSQTVGLVQLLRAHNIYHELIVIPDDLHESMLHSRWLYTWERMGDFLKRFVWDAEQAPTSR
jgi:dipeptidyl-peptidase 4